MRIIEQLLRKQNQNISVILRILRIGSRCLGQIEKKIGPYFQRAYTILFAALPAITFDCGIQFMK